MTKVCSKCHIEKESENFSNSKGILSSWCKVCWSDYYQQNKSIILERCKKYRLENLEKVKKSRKKYKSSNKDKIKESGRDYYKKNKDRVKLNGRKANLRKYGLTIELYNKILFKQNNKCSICFIDIAENGENLNIDHDHTCCPGNYSCGKCIRGLLCYSCNLGIGNLKDNITLLQNAINYLQSWNKITWAK